MPARRFPPPWSVEETEACFIVRDHNGQALAYVYSRRSRAGGRRPGRPSREQRRGSATLNGMIKGPGKRTAGCLSTSRAPRRPTGNIRTPAAHVASAA